MNVVPFSKWIPGLKHPLVIAGPCSAENEDQVMSTARLLAENDHVKIFRSGIWKPRTRPGSFEGVGEIGLPWLARVKKETGMMVTTEVANAKHVELALKHGIDILWIGARTSANPFSVQEIAEALRGVGIPVMVKNPINADLALWIGALERMNNVGVNKLVAIHRGFSNFEKTKYRNDPNWKIPIELKRRFPQLPIVCDPSHIAGKRDLVPKVCQKAMDVDFDGVMVETHCDPSVALSDAAQQVTPEKLADILEELEYRVPFSTDRSFEAELDKLRKKIDRIDHEIIDALQLRMGLVEKIGEAKKAGGITPLQITRMDEIMKRRTEYGEGLGLNAEYIKEIYHIIHEHSLKFQTDMMNVKREGQTTNETTIQ